MTCTMPLLNDCGLQCGCSLQFDIRSESCALTLSQDGSDLMVHHIPFADLMRLRDLPAGWAVRLGPMEIERHDAGSRVRCGDVEGLVSWAEVLRSLGRIGVA